MDLDILKKKLSSFRTAKGRLFRVPDELLVEILASWEQWTGPASGFYAALGADHRKMASLIGKAKKLKREGHWAAEEFKPVAVIDPGLPNPCGIEVVWDGGKLIRFALVEQLVDFLRAVGGSCTAPACPAKKVA
jgi:hypothetical protein